MGEQGADTFGNQGRYDFIDLIKGVGIFLVVWGHAMEPRSVYIYSFHMPLFFFISGYLHQDKPAREYFLGRIKRLYLPYLAFSVMSWLFYLTVLIVRDNQAMLPEHLGKLLSVLDGSARNGGNDSIWFLTCLLATSSLFWTIRRVENKVLIWLSVAASSAAGYVLGLYDIALPFKLDVALTGLAFYQLGHMAKKRNLLQYTDKLGRFGLGVAIVAAEAVHIMTAFHNVRISGIAKVAMTSNNLGNYCLFYVSALAGIAVMMTLGYKLRNIKFINTLGVNSLVILAFHKPILYLLKLTAAGLVKYGPRLNGLLFSLAAIALIQPLVGLIKRKFPWVLGARPNSASVSRHSTLTPPPFG